MVWRDLELRGTILISLLSQVVLIMLGNRRKYIAGKLIKIILWVAYLSADWAATVSLSAISNSFAYSKVDRSYVIMAFWAPFLLLHLGGPDTITALSLEDNELWQRHALGLFVQPLFADLILSFQDRKNSRSFFLTRTWEEAFDVIEYELGFMFDTFYTKAIVIYTYAGFWVIDKRTESPGDMGITYLLMGGAIVLELYATITLLFSDWSMLWFSRHKNTFLDLSYQVISWLRPRFQRFHLVPANDKWSDSLAGYNLINFCLLKRPAKCNKTNYRGSCCSFKWWGFILASARKFCIEMWHSDRYTNLEVIQNDLKRLIFEDLRLKSIQASQQAADMIKYCKQLCAERGDRRLKTEKNWAKEKWEMISHVWVEMLSYAANQCRFNYHALQLRQGGELLTHVCLLMTHLGISEKFQIAESHERLIEF
ncbi:hypothetical protein RCOM_0455910 [Ricinus communis]|uniref:DUF4220 domain-containing protein n=1 Tax=Ricinus communis TaxID=3988 RepID=B9SU30_RICCO|nr:hypothetical protein RCOM_0455910 [Ricinus communis]